MHVRNASAGKLGAMEDSPAVNVWDAGLQSHVITTNIVRELFLPESMLARPKIRGWWGRKVRLLIFRTEPSMRSPSLWKNAAPFSNDYIPLEMRNHYCLSRGKS